MAYTKKEKKIHIYFGENTSMFFKDWQRCSISYIRGYTIPQPWTFNSDTSFPHTDFGKGNIIAWAISGQVRMYFTGFTKIIYKVLWQETFRKLIHKYQDMVASNVTHL